MPRPPSVTPYKGKRIVELVKMRYSNPEIARKLKLKLNAVKRWRMQHGLQGVSKSGNVYDPEFEWVSWYNNCLRKHWSVRDNDTEYSGNQHIRRIYQPHNLSWFEMSY